jgi:RHS repeat-associated protein
VQLLEDSALPAVQTYRDQYAIAEDLDKYYQHPVYTDKPTVLDSLSHLFRKPDTIGKTIEMWLYNPVQSGNQIVATTPDHRFLFQTCINGTQMSIDVLSLDSTVTGSVSVLAANHYTVDISTRPSLGGWQHVVLMSNDFVAGTMQAYVNGQLMPAVSGSPYAGCGLNIGPGGLASNTPDNFSTLKHLRLYSRLMDASEIYKNVHDPYFRPSNDVTMYWFRANIPEPGSVTTIGTLNTDEFLFKPVFPQHRMPTTYTYNSTNQVSKQQSPDGGINRFWYDLLSRLSISQNDKQLPGNDYSYTTYDVLGRISEVSQKKQTTIALGDPDYLADATLSSFAAAGTDSQITHTYYDVAAPATNGMQSVTQNNLRKRVASSTYRDTQNGPVQQATYYDYDLDGNVKTLYQQLAGLDLKRIDYEYDLVSGKVNFVSYQKNQPDQFYYSYNYDAENRLTEAWSSPLATLSSYSRGSTLNTTKRRMDASYKYYLHGPLARMELGDVSSKVQGVDYAYTLQGWLKGVNRSIFRFQPQLTTDMGNDGSNGVPKDAFNYNLYYYLNDYKPIGGTDPFEHELQEDPTFYPLYNGNIAGIGQTLPAINQPSMVNSYRYDQLNRLTVNQPRQNNLPYALPEYDTMDEFFSYDGNGNIKTAFRHGDFFAAKKEMDDLTYNYNRDAQGNLINNKLRHVNDALPYYGSNNPQDLHDQVADNYQYDAIGNLIVDQQGAISNIKWTVYGKIDSITKTDGPSIKYRYDPTGQRASKTVNGITTWYVRDAQGNTMAVYDNKSNQINWREQGLYGSSRLGLWEPNVNLANNNAATVWDTVGHKEYELANHLGNVLVTITDKRLPHSTDGTTIDYYEPEVRMAQEYFAFGAPIPKRNYFLNDKQYRYGFNGKENDNEVKLDWSGNPINGSQQDYGMRIYDPRLGRFLSVDPITTEYPELTPYQFASNRPIDGIDLDGLEVFLASPEVLVEPEIIGPSLSSASASSASAASALSKFHVNPSGIQATGFQIPTYGITVLWAPTRRPPIGPILYRDIPQQKPQNNPVPIVNPKRQFNPMAKPSRSDEDEEGYYIYETGRSEKIRSEMVDAPTGQLPYFGITKNALVASPGINGRYDSNAETVKNLPLYRGILGNTDYQTAAGVETALVALNTYGKNFEKKILQLSSKDVRKSTRIDNRMFSRKDPAIVLKGIDWLNNHYKDWRSRFYHRENKKGKKGG